MPCIAVLKAELVCVSPFRGEDVTLMVVVITEESLHVVGKLTLFWCMSCDKRLFSSSSLFTLFLSAVSSCSRKKNNRCYKTYDIKRTN